MKTLKILLRKEFLQIRRNKFILIIMFMVPVVQLLILPLAATYEMKNISLSIVDNDRSSLSQKLISHFTASGYFRLYDFSNSHFTAMQGIEKNSSDLILEIPKDFERNILTGQSASLQLNLNAIDGSKAGLAGSYSSEIIRNFTAELLQQLNLSLGKTSLPVIDITYTNRFNASLNYPTFMVPGILVMLLTLVGGFLAALNIVSEKEKGTIEQINVTPVRKSVFIISKMIPFWIIGMVVFTIGLLICRFVYGIIPMGSYFTLYGFAMIYTIAVLGFGLLISTFSDNQQQAMFIAFFFLIIFILLSGEFTPISSMPQWAQIATRFNPLRYFVEVMRLVMLKGSLFTDVLSQFVTICVFAVLLNGWAVVNYKKTG